MTNHTAVIPDVEADIRWRDWQARGAASDRRTADENAQTDVPHRRRFDRLVRRSTHMKSEHHPSGRVRVAGRSAPQD